MKFNRVGDCDFPVETETDMWIQGSMLTSLQCLIDAINSKWPGISLDNVDITPYHHHEFAVGYDLYDWSDYVTYLYISLKED